MQRFISFIMAGVMFLSSFVFLPGFMLRGGRVGRVTLVLETQQVELGAQTIGGTLHNGRFTPLFRNWGGMYSLQAWDGDRWVSAGNTCIVGTDDVVLLLPPMRARSFSFDLTALDCDPIYIGGEYIPCCVPLSPGLHRIRTATSPRAYAEFYIV
ncbi:MAG: hypothetical protein FWB76_01225 [Oscillospiraceae bacterium]|nr:hypothetical protein [Oscillospiraceae bacterium]